MSTSYRRTSHHTVFCRFHSSPFLMKWNILEMCLVCLVSLQLLVIHTADLLSNIMRYDCYRTTSGSFFSSSLFSILKCAIDITEVNAALYSLSALDLETGPRTCVKWSIGPPWQNTIYDPTFLPVSGQSYQMESEHTTNWF